MTEVEIRANTVLPALREPITLRTADGLSLVGELALPVDRPPRATLVCLHPLPTHGGMMDSHLLRKAAWRLPALAGFAVLRFNTRGTASEAGCSEGAFERCVGEGQDLAAALEFTQARGLPEVWLLGWSFGTDLALRHGSHPAVRGAVLVAPPLRWSGPAELARWRESGLPVTCLVPEHDDHLRPEQARTRFAPLAQAEVVTLPGAKHLLVGYADVVLDEVVRVVAPELATPLPRRVTLPAS
ncbi:MULTISPECIES: alpha/beta hydrolase [unclassified Crossiella]|uniref:alpha/beta hydrolase n=1 Tax=unclassified Crossiella TaxID=2620835 RepID=UPI001FFEE0BC|nr:MULTISPECIES: alpha/beta hydrolase [unclassified Crossiella]MCK2258566.1 alpha/beta hydrolase [Crossiella sp. S99.1]